MNADDLARQAVRLLKRRGFQAFLVGGCVRDLLLGRKPKDWDVATDATPDQILALFPNSNLVGAQFGVVRVRQGEGEVEVATFRSDGEYDDGRRPRAVKYETDPREDAIRRDFTINALFLDPDTDQILDFVEGRADIGAGIVRAIGAPRERFREDHLRLLRAIRFAATLQFRIAAATWAAIRAMAGAVQLIAAERVRDELTRILTEGGARAGFELMDGCDLLRELLPEVAAMKGVEQPPQFHPEGDVWTHTLLLLDKLDRPTPALAWGALLHDVGKPATFRITDRIRFDGHVEVGVEIARGILNRLRFSREDADQVLSLIANHMKFKDAAAMKESTLKRFVRQPAFDQHLELHRIDCLSSNGQLDTYHLVKRKMAEYSAEQLKPPPLITGTDLIDWGYDPGPKFALILATVEDAQLEGTVQTSGEARRLVESVFQK